MSTANQILLWDDELRTLPSAFARSALFRAASRSKRAQIKGEIAAGEGLRIQFFGEELRTDDEELLMLILHNLRGRDVRDTDNLYIDISRYELLRALERPVDGRYYKELSASLDRMALGGLKLHYTAPNRKRYKITQSLIRKVSYSDTEGKDNGRFRIWLEPEVLQFFMGGELEQETFSIEWRQRVSLRRPFAKWLHSHLHALGFGSRNHVVCSMEVIWKLSGSEAADLKNFRTILQRGLQEMKDQEIVSDWSIRQGMLAVFREGPAVQVDWMASERGVMPLLAAASTAEIIDSDFVELDAPAATALPTDKANEPLNA